MGVPKGSGSLLTTGVYGFVEVVTTLAYVTVIVDRIGRRLPLIIQRNSLKDYSIFLFLFPRKQLGSMYGQDNRIENKVYTGNSA